MTAAYTQSASDAPPAAPQADPPPLENGDRLTRGEFMRRYEAMPRVNKAQLIEGIVYMPSPVNFKHHGEPHAIINGWLGYYVSKTPGLGLGDNSTVGLDEDNAPQPDLLLRLPEGAGGRSRVDGKGYLEGPPELLVEIAASSVSIDLNAKLNAYRRNGVAEYLVWRVRDGAIDWFVLDEGRYVPLTRKSSDKPLKSRTFPGLWLDPAALLAHDLARLTQTVEQGVATAATHAAFVQRLSAAPDRA